MKKIYTLILMALPFFAQSQTINQADLPVAGDAWTMNTDDGYIAAIPAGGTGQTWNYSTLLTVTVDTQAFISAAGTPYTSVFTSSNLAQYQTSDGSYSYFTSNASGLYLDGNGSSTGNFIYSPSLLYVPVPFTFGSTQTADSRIEIDTVIGTQNAKIIIHFHNTYEGDASGSLQIPTGTYNVVRMKVTQLVYDSVGVELIPGSGQYNYSLIAPTATQTTQYNFFSSGNPVNLIMGLGADSLGQNSTSSSYFSGQIQVSAQDLPSVKKTYAYPNPAYDKVNFNTIDLNADLVIFDQSGHEVKRVNGNIIKNIDVNSLSNGVYNYRLIYNNRTETGSFVVHH